MTIRYKPGNTNTDADALSRLPAVSEISSEQFSSVASAYEDQDSHEDWNGYADVCQLL